MDELITFFVRYFLDLRRLSAALTLVLACGMTSVWVSVESINGLTVSDRWMIGVAIALLVTIAAALLFAKPRSPADEAQAVQASLESTEIEVLSRENKGAVLATVGPALPFMTFTGGMLLGSIANSWGHRAHEFAMVLLLLALAISLPMGGLMTFVGMRMMREVESPENSTRKECQS